MARKNNQQKNGVERHSLNSKKEDSDVGGKRADTKKRKASEVKVSVGEELPNGKMPSNVFDESMNEFDSGGFEIKNEPKSVNFTEKSKVERTNTHEQSKDFPNDVRSCKEDVEASSMRERMGTPFERDWWKSIKNSSLLNGLHIKTLLDNLEFSDNVVVRSLKVAATSVSKSAGELLEQQRPMFNSVITKLLCARDYAEKKIKQTYPIVLKWLMHFGNILLLISMVWLDCALRGLDSFLRMGTTSFFSVLWCSIFSVISMVGLFKFLMVLVIAAFLGVFIGFILAIAAVVIFGTIFLWLYGSFWITTLVIFLGGLAFTLSHERVALLITTVYSVYCAWTYVGWLGVLLGLNLSFFSSDIMIYLLKNNTNEHRRPNRFPEQTNGMQGRHDFFNVDPVHDSPSETGPGISTDRNSGIPSTSGADSDITSEDEVIRLLNCTDHYSALGFSRYEDIDVSLLKKEYRKKAMLVHPDKNMGNEKAAEAFKKLQNAYEVLLDSLKRKSYDDELRREELLNIFRRFQSSSQKNGARGFFPSQFGGSENDGDDPFGESRQIACKKCNNFHMWAYTGKQKSRARWCQDCKDFHQAKDGDGWVEQTSQSLLFGLFQKVDAPSAYVCADSKIYNATEWYICQGMRCPANTHKPSFHVNTNVTSKHSTGKRTNSGQRAGRNPEEGVTEEEFFEWLQNAAQAGVFGEYSGGASADSPTAKAGNTNKNGGGGGGGGGGAGSKRKKKGKKQ